MALFVPKLAALRSILAPTALAVLVVAFSAPFWSACATPEPERSTYFERTISPILRTSCVSANTGASCHVADAKGNAFGNLDVSTYEATIKRRDLFSNYGAYGQPAFLLKNVPNRQLEVQTFDGTRTVVTTDIKHAGGLIFDPQASGYQTLRRWIESGATENNGGAPPKALKKQPCSTAIPARAGFDPSVDPARADFATFRAAANPVIQGSCAAGNCHGTEANELFLACGNTPEEVRWNYFAAREYLGQTAEVSELLRRPLDAARGGSFHEGGVVFENSDDAGYQGLLRWATEHGPLDAGEISPELRFFANRVQPVFVKKGCMMLHCHSASMFHDLRIRGGSGGSFSLSATRKNYELTLLQLDLESDDPAASRLMRKNLYRPELFPGGEGITHRGGALFEDFKAQPARPELCDVAVPPYDYDAGNLDEIPGYCVMREWLKRERASRGLSPLSAVVYVSRPLSNAGDRVQDFDVFMPGAELHLAQAAVDATGGLTVSGDVVLNDGCGLGASADIRRPAVSWDGSKIAFAARTSEGEPLQIYEANADGSACAKQALIGSTPNEQNGLLVHNFDPAYGPPNASGGSPLVFASTRGNLVPGNTDYAGPQRTPSDPGKPNANLYVLENGQVRQLTFLLNVEREPSFMIDGRLIYTVEKRSRDFYQLALRRQNLDGGDYHPLYAQRGSIGHHQASSVVETADKDFVAIFSEPGVPHRGGTLGIINRSLGIDFRSTDPADYPVDKTVLDPAAPRSVDSNFFLRSLSFADASVSGTPGTATTGLFATPAPLPSGKVLVSFGAASDPATFDGDYDVFVFDSRTGQRTRLLGTAGRADMEAVAVYPKAGRSVFVSRVDEPNGFSRPGPGTEADVTVLSMPLLSSLLFQNTPTGRTLEAAIGSFGVYEELPPPLDVASYGAGGSALVQDAFGQAVLRRRLLGTVNVETDGSARMRIPGGVPIQLELPPTVESTSFGIPRLQRESMAFYPGETSHQGFRVDFFDNMCAGCHAPVSGRPTDAHVNPDVLSQASDVYALTKDAQNLAVAPALRGPVLGP